ncbi:MAG TPA: STAS domain-containing protein [Acidothermaceae bacterium]
MADRRRASASRADSAVDPRVDPRVDSHIVGRLDVTTAADLRADLIGLLERDGAAGPAAADLVVDLSAVETVDMVGVGLLVGVHRQAQRHGRRLVLTGVPPRVMRLLTATRLRRVLAVRDLPRSRPGLRLPDDGGALAGAGAG